MVNCKINKLGNNIKLLSFHNRKILFGEILDPPSEGELKAAFLLGV